MTSRASPEDVLGEDAASPDAIGVTRHHRSKGTWAFSVLLTCFALWTVTTLVIFYQLLSWPYIGATFISDTKNRQIIVDTVAQGGPAERGGLKSGQRIIALINSETGERYVLNGFEAIRGRHQLHSYEEAKKAGRAQDKAWTFTSANEFQLETASGETLTVSSFNERGYSSLPGRTFTSLFQSLVVLLISGGIFAFAPRSTAVNLLLLSGLGLVVNMITNSVIAARELGIPPYALDIIYHFNAVFSILFSYGLLALLWHFPSRISRFPFASLIIAGGLSIYLVQTFELFEFPIHPFQIPNLIPFPIAVAISFIQWRRTRDNPLDRAALMWFMLSIYGVVTLVVMLYSIPIMLQYPPLISPHLATLALTLLFVGMALGTLRYRLFDIHRIWWKAIVWIAGGFVVLIADVLLISQFDLDQSAAIPLALFIAGWTYFPLRQMVLQYFVGSREIRVSEHVPDLIETFSGIDDSAEFDGKFIAFLRRSFRADDISLANRGAPVSGVLLLNNGLKLQVPNASGTGAVELIGKAHGRQLFSPSDVKTAQAFLRLVRNMGDARHRERARRQQERDSIVRDLHDDVGGRLLSLIYKSKDKAAADNARDTLAALKESLIVVENTQSIDLSVAWQQFAEDAEHRLTDAGFETQITKHIKSERVLSAREFINLKRSVQELVSNILKYGANGPVSLVAKVDLNETIEIHARNETGDTGINTVSSKRGLSNIETRMREIGGSLATSMHANEQGKTVFEATIELPFDG